MSPAALGIIQSGIAEEYETIDRFGVIGELRDAGAEAELDFRQRQLNRQPLEPLLADSLYDFLCLFGVGRWKYDDELVASVAEGGIGLAQRLRERLAKSASMTSPLACPNLSLYFLNPSRSIMAREMQRP